MNNNDILAQLQAAQNQAMQTTHDLQIVLCWVTLAMFIVSAWVLYMFYARLRDIADELRKFRIAYQMAEVRKSRPPQSPPQPDELV